MGYEVKIGLSNKHLHLQKEHIEILFGKGHELTPTKPLVQPGQFACEEKVDIVGPKNTLKGIRVLGPARPETQVEVAMTDARTLGIKAPVRESGKLEGTPGCKIVGPCGEVEIDHLYSTTCLYVQEMLTKEKFTLTLTRVMQPAADLMLSVQ